MIKMALVFPGQGTQYVGMGKKIYEEHKVATQVFEEASDAISVDLKNLCFESDPKELRLTYNAQPAILATSVAMYKVFAELEEIEPDLFAGHSLGEISALTCVGAIELGDAVKIARARGQYMQEAVPEGEGMMIAVKHRDIAYLEQVCSQVYGSNYEIGISNYNSKVQTVLSGTAEAVLAVEAILHKENIETKQLNVSAPFHSKLMKPAADKFAEELEKYTFSEPKYNIVSSVTGMLYHDAISIADNLVKQIYSPVRWVETMQCLKDFNISYGVEMGPGHVLQNLMKANISDIKIYAYDNKSDIEKVRAIVKNSYASFIKRSMGIAVAVRNNNDDNKEYEKSVIIPYRKIKDIDMRLEVEGREPNEKEMQEAVEMLISVFQTKKVPVQERILRMKNLFKDTGTTKEFCDFDYSLLQEEAK